MTSYYVHKFLDAQNDHEVHRADCYLLSQHNMQNFTYLGEHLTCLTAVAQARNLGYTRANGCIHCAPACHTH
jgi:hypothetical protein